MEDGCVQKARKARKQKVLDEEEFIMVKFVGVRRRKLSEGE